MTGDPSARVPREVVNPFPATAVASGAETVTVSTPAIHEARHLLDGYLTAPAKAGSGNVIAIVGDYGTGKTHLAAELLRHIDRTAGSTTHTISLEASTGTFVRLYHAFVAQLDQVDVTRRVREYYTDVVADDLGLSELTAGLVPKLRSGELDPVQVVDQLKLMDSDLLQRVRRKLEDVTNKEEFSTALTLLLRTGFDRAVWEWFRGGVPDQILVDRNIKDPIMSDDDALEAMGVFALLYGHRGHRFVLVIDELDKLLSTSPEAATPTTATPTMGFKRMLEVFAAANALLILVGLPDYIDAVGKTVVERVGRIIRVSALTTGHVEEYIRRRQQEASDTATLAPFTHNSVKYLVDITDGVARKVVRLCHHLYRKAVSEGTEVTEAMVREVARAQVGFFVNIESVRREVRRTLDAQGLRYVRDYSIGSDARAHVDYWIPLGDRDSGCAVLITNSVFGTHDVQRLNETAILIKNAVADAQTVLIVLGYLPAVLSQELTEVFGIEPLVYDRWTFNESLAAILSTRARLVEDASTDDPLTVVRNNVERMNRQQINTQRLIEKLAAYVDTMQASTNHEFGAIRRDLDGITQALQSTGVAWTTGQGTAPPSLPQSVSVLFDDTSSALSALSQVDDVFQKALTGAGRSLPDAVEARMAIRTRLGSAKLFEAVGVVSLLRTLLDAFRNAVTDWYRLHASGVRDVDKEELSALCRSYDALYDVLPLFRLTEFDEFEVSMGGAEESFRQTLGSTRLADTYEAFNDFASRVQTALLSELFSASATGD
ncbi:MAG: AAA family ATPase [Pseudonocardiaceae bacterium]